MTKEDFAEYYKKVESGEIKPFELMRMLQMKQSTFYKYREEIIGKK